MEKRHRHTHNDTEIFPKADFSIMRDMKKPGCYQSYQNKWWHPKLPSLSNALNNSGNAGNSNNNEHNIMRSIYFSSMFFQLKTLCTSIVKQNIICRHIDYIKAFKFESRILLLNVYKHLMQKIGRSFRLLPISK